MTDPQDAPNAPRPMPVDPAERRAYGLVCLATAEITLTMASISEAWTPGKFERVHDWMKREKERQVAAGTNRPVVTLTEALSYYARLLDVVAEACRATILDRKAAGRD